MGFYDAIRIGASGAASAYEVERSLRFNDDDSPYLSRQPSSNTSGSSQKITISFWIKLGNIPSGTNGGTFFGSSGNTHMGQFFNQTLYFDIVSTYWINTTGVFRDPSAWYHVVYAVDTTQSTSTNRQKIYVNGVLQDRGDTVGDPSQNAYVDYFNNSSTTYYIGRRQAGNYFDGYLAEINFIDGYAYDESYFGETDALTGQWIPKKYGGSYGTNGFYLNFSDNSGTTATTLGKDSSGNGNNFTPNNLAVSDAMPDTPTNNFATMNPLNGYSGLSEGNLRFNFYNDSAGNRSTQATIALPKSGKWYWEARYQESGTGTVTTKYFGLSQIHMATGYVTAPYVYYDGGTGVLRNGNASDNVDGKQVWYNGTGVPALLGIAVDVDNNSVEYFHNGSSQGTIPLPTLTSSQEYFFTWANTSGGSSSTLNDTFNFGADSTFQGQASSGGNTDANGVGDFKYAPPSGHLALCSANLPDPTIKLPNKHFAAFTYTGTGSSGDVVNITNSDVDFTPDWVWVKTRNVTNDHILSDSVRGGSKYLVSSETYAEQTNTQKIRAFIQNGFESGTDGDTNWSGGRPFVAWNWNAGDTDGKTYTVTVVSDSGNKYRFDGFGTSAVTLDLAEGGTYIFDQSDSSNAGHPLRFSTTSNGTHGGGSEYTTGVTTSGTPGSSGAFTQIVVAASAPTLYYYCTQHSGMGGQANTNSTLGSSNFDGNNQSIVKVNASAGFSILKYTGTGANSTLVSMGHGLGVKPSAVFIKNRTRVVDWVAWIDGVGGSATDNQKNLALNTNAAAGQNSSQYRTSDSTTITVRDTDSNGNNKVNRSGDNYISYVFSEVAGYSKFGSYVGNGSSSGPFLFTGFRPAWVLIKNSGASGFDWVLQDATRSPFNVANEKLNPNTSAAAQTGNDRIDILSNGFKCRDSSAGINANNSSYIYLAFAESPFKNARAR